MFGSILRQLSLSGDEDGQFLSHWLNSLEKRASLSLKIDQVIPGQDMGSGARL